MNDLTEAELYALMSDLGLRADDALVRVRTQGTAVFDVGLSTQVELTVATWGRDTDYFDVRFTVKVWAAA